MIVKIPSIRENVSIVESFIENAGDKVKIKEFDSGTKLTKEIVEKLLTTQLYTVTRRTKIKKSKYNFEETRKVYVLLLKMRVVVLISIICQTQLVQKTLRKLRAGESF